MKVFRLNKTDEDGATVFTVDGQLATEYVNIVEESCDSAVNKRQASPPAITGRIFD